MLYDPTFDHFPDLDAAGDSVVQIIKGTAEPGWNDVSMTVRSLVELAEHRLRVTTAYFVPDDDLLQRLCRAAERGVEVQLLIPGPHADKRFVQLASESSYRELLEAGVEVWCYQPSMLHAKVLTVDGAVGVIGSANCNRRSTSLDEEVNLVVFDEEVAVALDEDFDADLAHSERLDLERWERRTLAQRALEGVTAFIRPWM